MSIASHSGRRVAYVPEVTWGTIPATPAFKTLRTTSGGLRTNKMTGVSEEIDAGRNVKDIVHLGQDVAGDISFEQSYSSFDDLLEGLFFGTWSSNVLKNGITPKSFTFEDTLEKGATDMYQRYPGCMVDSLSLSIRSREMVTGSFKLMGQKEIIDAAIVSGATYAAANSEPISTASANVAAFTLGGNVFKVKSLQLEIKSNLRTRPIVGSLYSEEFGVGRFECSGSLEVYLEDPAVYEASLAHAAAGALTFTVGNATNKKLTWLLPKLIPASSEIPKGGNNDDVMLNWPFQAVYDATEACTAKLTRAVV